MYFWFSVFLFLSDSLSLCPFLPLCLFDIKFFCQFGFLSFFSSNFKSVFLFLSASLSLYLFFTFLFIFFICCFRSKMISYPLSLSLSLSFLFFICYFRSKMISSPFHSKKLKTQKSETSLGLPLLWSPEIIPEQLMFCWTSNNCSG